MTTNGALEAEYCFVFDKEIQQGPFPPGKVQRMLRDGEISDQAFVWREGMTDWPPIGSVLPRLATIRQKEYLKFLAHAIPRELTFDEAQSMLDAIIADNPAKKLAFERWDQLAQKRDAVATYFARSEIRCPVSEFEIVPFLEEVQAADPEQFSSLPHEITHERRNSDRECGWRGPAADQVRARRRERLSSQQKRRSRGGPDASRNRLRDNPSVVSVRSARPSMR